MSASNSAFHKLCSRLNVKPKQFAVLLVISTVALGVLGLKVFVLKPKSASAAGTKTAAKKSPEKAPGKPGEAGASAEATMAFPAPENLPVIPVVFENRPMRDPFVPFFVYRDPEGTDPSLEEVPLVDAEGGVPPKFPDRGAGTKSKSKRGASKSAPVEPDEPQPPEGLALKAIVGGKVAVLGNKTVEEGNSVTDDTGRKFTVLAITMDFVKLSDGQSIWTVDYSTGASGKSGKPGGKR